MDGSSPFSIRTLDESDIKRIAFINNASEIAGYKAKGVNFSRPERKRGRAVAEDFVSRFMGPTLRGEEPKASVLGAVSNDQVMGYVWYGPNLSPIPLFESIYEFSRTATIRERFSVKATWEALSAKDVGEIRHLYLCEDQHGQGLGRQLFNAASYNLRESGFSTIRLLTEQDNDRARAFYERQGGRTSGQVVAQDRNYSPMIAYRW